MTRADNLMDEVAFPSWTRPDGTRCIALGPGVHWCKSEDELAEFALDVLTSENPSERHLAIIERLTTPEERAQIEQIVRMLSEAVVQ